MNLVEPFDSGGRWGCGDEFAAFLPATNADAAHVALDRVRLAIAHAMAARAYGVTASIGATVFAEVPASVDAAMLAADERMYIAKHLGKNRVSVAAALRRRVLRTCLC